MITAAMVMLVVCSMLAGASAAQHYIIPTAGFAICIFALLYLVVSK